MENTKLRDNDLLAQARRVIAAERARGCEPSLRRVAVLSVFSPAKSFYAGYMNLYRGASHFLAAQKDSHTGTADSCSASQARIRTVALRCRDLMEKRGMSLSAALTVVLAGGAPRFYISIPYAMRIIGNALRQPAAFRNV
ncbi:MAG: hypothetical protein Q4F07_00615 [Bacteroidales bacterium]|nr:hypothetical protein [Bacteroidales bacterium]